MSPAKKGVRITVVVEDRRQERFCREVLGGLGYRRHEITYKTAPKGKGSGKAWVNSQAANELQVLRSKNFQSLALLITTDCDQQTIPERINELEGAYKNVGIEPPCDDEAVAYYLPKWAIEAWIRFLRGEDVTEAMKNLKNKIEPIDFKAIAEEFLRRYRTTAEPSLPSLDHGLEETNRIDII